MSLREEAGADESGLALSLVRGDVFFELQKAIGLVPEHGLGLVRRAVFWAVLCWLPMAGWALWAGRALSGQLAEPLLVHFGIHARFLLAVPLLILAEGPLHRATTRILPHFVRSGLVAESGRPGFESLIARFARVRAAWLPAVVILALTAAGTTAGAAGYRAEDLAW